MTEIRKKAFCIRRSLRIIEAISESAVNEVFLQKALQFLDQEHFDAAIEERTSNLRCGYFLCYKPINIITQKFRICRTNACVYDMENRKKYCSDWCFAAGEYLKKQVSTEPLWQRTSTFYEIISFQFLSAESNGSPGDILTKVDPKYYSSTSLHALHANVNSSGNSNLETFNDIHSKQKITNVSDEISKAFQSLGLGDDDDGHSSNEDSDHQRDSDGDGDGGDDDENQAKKCSLQLKNNQKKSVEESDILDVVFHRLSDWFTDETKTFLWQRGERENVELNENEKKYFEKIQKFYGTLRRNKENDDTRIYPLKETSNQNAIRQRLLYDRFIVCIRPIYLSMKSTNESATKEINLENDLQHLLKTFNLTAKNAALTSVEWHPIAFVLLLLLLADSPIHFQKTISNYQQIYDNCIGRDFQSFCQSSLHFYDTKIAGEVGF